MKLSLIHRPAIAASASPYRLVDEHDEEIVWANDFLDAQRVRQLSIRSLRAYAYDLLHFARWRLQRGSPSFLDLDESTLLAYVRDQLTQQPQPTPQTINHRINVLRSWYRFHAGHPLAAGSYQFQRFYHTRSPLGYGRSHRVLSVGLRLQEPKRLIMPLSADEVARFWASFHTFRDLALVALMLLSGMRSQETLDLRLEDLQLGNAQICVLGKGNKQRMLPLSPETITALQNYLRLERPVTTSPTLFVSLKGRHKQTTRTIAQLAESCAQFRAQGFASDDGEFQEGVRCVAAPIRAQDGMVIGSIGISAPVLRFPKERNKSMGSQVREIADQISAALSAQTSDS